MRDFYTKIVVLIGMIVAIGNDSFSQCTPPSAPTGVTASPSTVSCGQSANLVATSAGNTIGWFTVAFGGTAIGTSASGANFSVTPGTTTTYYAEAQSGTASGSQTFNYTGTMQTFTVPAGITTITIDAFGAEGLGFNGFTPGQGGRAKGDLTVTPGQVINVYVGGQALFNGGGAGKGGANGGDASDVRVGGTALANRVIVAGGGGGAGGDNWSCFTGNGDGGGGTVVGANFVGGGGGSGYSFCGGNGGNTGGTSSSNTHGGGGGGGGLTSGGAGAASSLGVAVTGTLGLGGAAYMSPSCSYTGGGGGGYYGGGGAAGNNCGAGQGGGGSSWTGTLANPLFAPGVRNGNGQIIISWTGTPCVSPTRTPVTVTVTTPGAPTPVTASPSTVSCGQTSNLVATSVGNIIGWFTAASGGTALGTSASGANFPVTPVTTTTYYAEAQAGVASGTQTFSYTGSMQTFTVPAGVTAIQVDAKGAQGGTGTTGLTAALGGRIQTTITVTPGQVLNIFVGGAGGNLNNVGGYNGGSNSPGTSYPGNIGGGGGASDIRIGGIALTDRVVVAGGGGGGGYNGCTENGGAGGGTTGASATLGCGLSAPGGGSQVGGGVGGTYSGYTAGSPGTLGIGGAGGTGTGGAGGGGGYYGGGGGCWQGGGGGSNYSNGSGTTHTQGFQSGNGQIVLSWTGTACYSPSRTPVTVTVTTPSAPSPVTASPPTVGCGQTSNLNATSAGNSIGWFTAASGGTAIGTSASGANFAVNPVTTTTYYAESQSGSASGSQTFSYTGSIQTFTVPAGVTSISIDARGAQGGGSNGGAGGLGAKMTGNYTVTPGQVLSVVVGQQGLLQVGGNAQNSSGGGGGTFVYSSGPTLLVAAGGGGGKCNYTGSAALHPGAAGQITTAGGASSDGNAGGAGGNGGNAGLWVGTPCSGGGAGWLTVGGGPYGGQTYSTWTGGTAYCAGGGGGCGGVGGYGGGGGSGNLYGGGGGGGGYSGGGGGTDPTHGGGGGSFSSGSGQVNTAGFQAGNGQVIFSWTGTACASPTRTPVTVTVTALSAPTAVTANPSTVSCGQTSNLNATSAGNNIGWFTAASGGTAIGTSASGANFGVNPVTTTTYYAETQSVACSSPTRTPVTVTVTTPGAPSPVTASPPTVTCGQPSNLNATSAGNMIGWFTVPSGGTAIGTSASGANYVVNPLTTTTYYAETQGGSASGSQTFNYTGSMQTFTVPAGITTVTIDAFGAEGLGFNGFTPGQGGRAKGDLTVTPGQVLNVYVGGQALFNGGGQGKGGANGGDASDVRVGGTALANRVIVAGGGGGAGGDNWSCFTGNGDGGGGTAVGTNCVGGGGGSGYSFCGGNGGNTGGTSSNATHGGGGGGGGFTSGGVGAASSLGAAITGTLGQGGASYMSASCGYTGGGGGGYYGGGGAAGNNCGAGQGGGGSSWTGTLANPLFAAGVRNGNGQIVISWSGTPCVSPTRTAVTVTVTTPSAPIAIASPSTVSCGQSSNLVGTSAGNTIGWFTAASGGTALGTSASGANFPVSPSSTTTYYAETQSGVSSGSQTFNYTGAIQTFTVPAGVTSLVITAKGASGGYNGGTAGNGATMTGTFTVTPGQVLSILAGQSPGSTGLFPAGGGGSFVGLGASYTTATPMIVAGGGGAGYSGGVGVGAPVTTSGTGTNPGVNGNGAPAGNCTGGGGGYYTSGGNDINYNFGGGQGFQQGGAGGLPNPTYAGSYQVGGFGGGAPGNYVGSCNNFAGNGGGYSGGSAWGTALGYYGNAGGSFNGGTSQNNTAANNVGNGQVIITWTGTLCTSPSRTPVTVTVTGPSAPTSVTANPSTVSCGQSSNLNATSAGNQIGWFTAASGGTAIGTSASGANFAVFPGSTTTYYAEAQAGAASGTQTFSYTGSMQTFTVPAGVTTVTIDAYGAEGLGFNGFTPGQGGRAQGDLTVTPGQVLNVYVGGQALFNGGGQGKGGANGGDASDVRVGGTALANRVIVAGGGGGAGGDSWSCFTGNGDGGGGTAVGANFVGGGGGSGYSFCGGNGGNAGGTSSTNTHGGGGGGGGLTSGGVGAASSLGAAVTGTLGQGGAAYMSPSCSYTGGGGGGYYGGGGAAGNNCGAGQGGGGSSWTGTLANPVFAAGVRNGNGQIIISWNGVACTSATRVPVTVTVTGPSAPTSVTATPPNVCVGGGSNLNATSAGNLIGWYTVPTGGTTIGTSASGANFAVVPATTTTYYAEAQAGAGSGSQTFTYTGSMQTFTVPAGVTALVVDASGGKGGNGSTGTGGNGGRVQTTITVTPGQVLNLFVGGAGGNLNNTAGYNGGGTGSGAYPSNVGGGGGASDIRIGGIALGNRVVVAGGGGGGAYNGCTDNGGAGGGTTGANGLIGCGTTVAGGGTPSAGGAGGTYSGWPAGVAGTIGVGGNGGATTGGSGGGGGYYGGGGGAWQGGGGGSSYSSGASTTHTQGYNAGNGQIILSWTATLCTSSTRTPVTVTVGPPAAPAPVTATPSTICIGSSSNLNATSAGNTIQWYTVASGGSSIGSTPSGTNFTVTPASTTTYYAETQVPGGPGGSQTFNYTGNSIQNFTVPVGVTSITINAKGAQGGAGGTSPLGSGGLGANMTGTFTVTPGQVLKILVGQQGGGSNVTPGAGGGGGTFVTDIANAPMIIAGGGGGRHGILTPVGINANVTGNGSDGYSDVSSPPYPASDGIGGINGNGATGANPHAGNGGGLLTNGQVALCGGPGFAFINGGNGGTSCTANIDFGGFGGGGGGGNNGGGGGGGYSGGGGAYHTPTNGGGGGSYNNGSSPTNLVNNTGNGQVVITWLATGCVSATRTPITVTVAPAPSAPTPVTASPSTVCVGSPSDLNATSAGNTIQWYTVASGGSNIGTSASGANFPVTPGTTTTYYAEAAIGGTCVSATRTPVTVTVTPIPSAPTPVTANPSAICAGTPADLNATSAGNTIQWYTIASGGTNIGTSASGANFPVTPGTTTTYYAESAAGTCLSTTRTPVTVTVNPTPTAPNPVTATSSTICSGDISNLNATSAGNTIQWYTVASGGSNIGTSASGANFPVTPGTTTTYYAESAAGTCLSTTRTPVTVTVNPTPTAPNPVTATSSTICSGDISNLNATSAGNTIQWYTVASGGSNIGTSASGANFPVTPGTTTTYYAESAAGTCLSTTRTPVIVTVNPTPTAPNPVTATSSTICSGDISNLNATSAGNTIAWFTVASGGSNIGTSASGANFPVTPGTTTTYYAESNTGSCISTTRTPVTVTVNPAPSAPNPVTATASTICDGNTANLNATSAGNTIAWFTVASGGANIGTSASGANFPVTPSTTTTYYAESSTGSCISPTRTPVTVTVNPTPSAPNPVTATASTICDGSSSNLNATSAGNTIQWYTVASGGANIGTSVSGANFPVTPNTTTTYYAESYTGSCMSTTRTPVTVTVDPIPSAPAPVVANASTICIGGSSNLNGTSAGNTIQWYTVASGGTNIGTSPSGSNFSVTPASTTTYYAEVITGIGCLSTSRTPVTVTVDPVAVANAGNGQTICYGSTVNLGASSSGGASAGTWTGGVGSYSSNSNPSATYTPNLSESGSTITLTWTTNATGACAAAMDTVSLSVNSPATVNAGSDITTCGINPITFGASMGGSASSILWSGTFAGTVSNLSNPTATYTPDVSEMGSTLTMTITTNDPDGSGPCPSVSDNVDVIIGGFSTTLAPPVPSATPWLADYENTDVFGWTHYYDDNGTPTNYCDDYILLSIQNTNSGGNAVGHVGDPGFIVKVGGQGAYSLNNGTTPYVSAGVNWYLMGRYWEVTPVNQPINDVNVKFYFTNADFNAVNALSPYVTSSPTQMAFYKINNGVGGAPSYNPDPALLHAGIPVASPFAYNGTGYWQYFNGVASSSNWAYTAMGTDHAAEYTVDRFSGGGGGGGTGNAGAFPVELLSFTGYNIGNENVLEWTTTREINNKEFILMHSMDNIAFEEIANIPTLAPNGMSNTAIQYATNDNDIAAKTYYRLKQVDIDGTSRMYPAMVEVNVNTVLNTVVSLYPNPAKDLLNISITQPQGGKHKIEIYDAVGKLVSVHKEDLKGGNTIIPIDVSTLAIGTYIVMIKNSDNGTLATTRFVKE